MPPSPPFSSNLVAALAAAAAERVEASEETKLPSAPQRRAAGGVAHSNAGQRSAAQRRLCSLCRRSMSCLCNVCVCTYIAEHSGEHQQRACALGPSDDPRAPPIHLVFFRAPSAELLAQAACLSQRAHRYAHPHTHTVRTRTHTRARTPTHIHTHNTRPPTRLSTRPLPPPCPPPAHHPRPCNGLLRPVVRNARLLSPKIAPLAPFSRCP